MVNNNLQRRNKFSINTGNPRSIAGHIVSGAITTGITTVATNYHREAETKKLVAKTGARFLQGGIATGSAISAANHIGQNSWFKALGAITSGVAGAYAVERLYQLWQKSQEAKLESKEK